MISTAVFLLILGSVSCYFLRTAPNNQDMETAFSLVLSLTIALPGVLLICASSDWWMKR